MKKTLIILLAIVGIYSCNQKEKNEMKERYYFDKYTPNDPENKSGTTTDKKTIDYNSFEKEFREIDWESYPANPTISVYNKNTILWVALYATSEDVDKLQMFIVGHHYKKDVKTLFGKKKEKDFSTTHMMVGKDKVLPLFKFYFDNNNTEEIIAKLKRLDAQFKQETRQ